MRLRCTLTAALLAALIVALAGAGTAGAVVVAPESAKAPCPSCQADDPEAPVATTTIVISGHGYGHGVGMSQYGAYGMASAGIAYGGILRFYYPGTKLGKAPVSVVRVLLADAVPTARISSAAAFVAIDASGATWTLPAGEVVLDRSLSLPVGDGGALLQLAGPLVFKPKSAALALDGKRYRGSLKVGLVPPAPPVPTLSAILAPVPATAVPEPPAAAPGTSLPPATAPTATVPSATAPSAPPAPTLTGLRVVNRIGLEAYLAGVVPHEVPASWPAAALQAQAVAARSYALAHRTAGVDFDLYADERSQVYGGIAGEVAATTAAVKATAASVLLYAGEVADTLFSASNGGRTLSAAEAYPGNPDPPPYLVARADPYDAAASPFASWGPVVVAGSTIESALGLPGTLIDLTVDAAGEGRPTEILAITGAGTIRIAPARLRAALGLRSSWVSLGVLSLSRSLQPVGYGRKLTLSGVVRGLSGVLLEQRTAAGWQGVAAPVPDGSGQFSIETPALVSADFRLSGGSGGASGSSASSPVAGGILAVPVVSKVKLQPSIDLTGLSGVLRPAMGGARVEIQFDGSGTGTSWQPVGTATVGVDGAFVASFPVAGGAYRAVVPTASGLAAAISAPVRITIPS